MSAYLCDEAHLSAIAEILCGMDKATNEAEYFDRVLLENLRSLRYRYPNTEHKCNHKYKPQGIIVPWDFNRMDTKTLCVWLKALLCYFYQSCEHPQWETCEIGKKVELSISRIKQELVNQIPEYKSAPWGWK